MAWVMEPTTLKFPTSGNNALAAPQWQRRGGRDNPPRTIRYTDTTMDKAGEEGTTICQRDMKMRAHHAETQWQHGNAKKDNGNLTNTIRQCHSNNTAIYL